MSSSPHIVFVSSLPEKEDTLQVTTKIVDHLNKDVKRNEEGVSNRLTVVLGGGCRVHGTDTVLGFPSVMGLLVWLYRKFGLQKNEREIVINEEDQLVILQLCLAEVNKQLTGDFDVDMSDVLIANKALIGQKLGYEPCQNISQEVLDSYTQFLQHSNTVDFMHVIANLKEELSKSDELKNFLSSFNLVSFYSSATEIEKEAFRFLCGNENIVKADLEVPLGGGEVCSITTSMCTYADILQSPIDNCVHSNFSTTEVYLEHVFISYMQLLVNSRSELALARVLNVPDRELNHQAFTALKREAKAKSMPMYQTASSYIMRIRLGGKGYAPDPTSAINTYVKGVGEFVDFIHKIQTVIEEEPEPRSAVQRVINMIKVLITRSKTNTLRKSSIDMVAEHLKQLVPQCIAFTNSTNVASPQRADSNGGSVLGRKALQILRQISDKKVTQPTKNNCTDVLSDLVTSQKTPVRLPSLFSQFRSPEILEGSPDSKLDKSLAERMLAKVKKVEKKQAVPRYQTSFDWAHHSHNVNRPEDDMFFKPQEAVTGTPIITTVSVKSAVVGTNAIKVLESLNDQENVQQGNTLPTENRVEVLCQTKKAPVKRGLNVEDSAPAKKQKLSTKTQGKKTSKKSAVKPLPKGQKQMTHFFRV